MKYGLVVLVGVIAGCVSHAPHHTVHVAAPKVLRSQALKVGQWVTYVEREGGREVGRLLLAVVAEGECGTWVRAHVTNGESWHTWVFCVRDHGTAPTDQLARAMLDDGATHRIDVANLGEHTAEVEALLTRIVPPALAGAYAREDVLVDAGSFHEALRVDNAGASTWLHPAVPFGGVVKVTDGHGREDVLYESGDSGEEVERDFASWGARRRREGTYELDAALGWFSGTNRRPSSSMTGLSVVITRPVSRRFDWLAHAAGLDDRDLGFLSAGVGVRWLPFRLDRGFATNQLFLDASVDYAQLNDSGRNILGRGAGLSTGVGYAAWSRHDWTFTINLEHRLAYLDAGHGLTQSISAALGFQLAFP